MFVNVAAPFIFNKHQFNIVKRFFTWSIQMTIVCKIGKRLKVVSFYCRFGMD